MCVCMLGVCNNKDCPYQHVDPESKVKDCPWYDRGFCKHGQYCYSRDIVWKFMFVYAGQNCRNRHTRRVLCQNYLCGFCVEGSSCKFVQYVHPTFPPMTSWITNTWSTDLIWLMCFSARFELPQYLSQVATGQGPKVSTSSSIDIKWCLSIAGNLHRYRWRDFMLKHSLISREWDDH